jgi:hypothetical protein
MATRSIRSAPVPEPAPAPAHDAPPEIASHPLPRAGGCWVVDDQCQLVRDPAEPQPHTPGIDEEAAP